METVLLVRRPDAAQRGLARILEHRRLRRGVEHPACFQHEHLRACHRQRVSGLPTRGTRPHDDHIIGALGGGGSDDRHSKGALEEGKTKSIMRLATGLAATTDFSWSAQATTASSAVPPIAPTRTMH